MQLVLACDVLAVGNDHPCHQTTKRGDTIPLSDTEDAGINVGSTSLQGTVGIGNSATSIVVEMCLNVTRDDTSQGTDEVVDLSG